MPRPSLHCFRCNRVVSEGDSPAVGGYFVTFNMGPPEEVLYPDEVPPIVAAMLELPEPRLELCATCIGDVFGEPELVRKILGSATDFEQARTGGRIRDPRRRAEIDQRGEAEHLEWLRKEADRRGLLASPEPPAAPGGGKATGGKRAGA
jgi:hypothetical protein